MYKERTTSVGIYRQKSYVVIVSLISYPYSNSLAPYLGTAILTILCFRHLLDNETNQQLIGHTSALR